MSIFEYLGLGESSFVESFLSRNDVPLVPGFHPNELGSKLHSKPHPLFILHILSAVPRMLVLQFNPAQLFLHKYHSCPLIVIELPPHAHRLATCLQLFQLSSQISRT